MKLFKILIIIFLNFTILINSNEKKFVIGQHSASGFFSIFLGALNKIFWAKRNNKVPVVYWGKDCLFYQKSGYNNSFNVWEYYFEPVSHLSYKNGDIINKNYFAPDGFGIPYHFGCYNSNFHKNLKFIFNGIINKYIKIKPSIKEKINSFYRKKMAGKINIGIHLRGTDKNAEAKTVDPNLILTKANELSKNLKNFQFFIATDEERLLALSKTKLKGRVIYYDSYRSTNGVPIHYYSRPQNPALSGEEILIEAQLLSKCDFFLHTRSNVATGVMLFNPQIKNIFFIN